MDNEQSTRRDLDEPPVIGERPPGPKLVPDWRVHADDQIVLVGFVALATILGALGLQFVLDGDSSTDAALDPSSETYVVADSAQVDTDALAQVGDLFDIDTRSDGGRAILTGFVASAAVSADAGRSALAVSGIDEVAAIMTATDHSFEVQGFTDTDGSAERNAALSQQRADAVREQLVARGIAAERLTSNGFGETEQFGDGNSAEALAKNRRVQFVAS